jgi:hypothetical protein
MGLGLVGNGIRCFVMLFSFALWKMGSESEKREELLGWISSLFLELAYEGEVSGCGMA